MIRPTYLFALACQCMQASEYPANASKIALDHLRPKNQTDTSSYSPAGLLPLPDHKLLIATNRRSSKIDRITPLQKAVLQNNHAFVMRELANPSSDPNQRSEQGFHLLHFAAQNGSPAILKTILKHLPDHNIVDSYGQTPLHLAVANGCMENVKILLDYGANPLLEIRKSENAIDIAINAGHHELAEYLMCVPFSTDTTSPFVGNALQHAIIQGDDELVQRLLSKGAKPHLGAGDSLSPYEMAKQHPNPLIYRHFTSVVTEHFSQADRTIAVMSHGYPASRHFNQFYSTLEKRLKKGANPNDLLPISINSGMDEIASLLISYGARPTTKQFKQLTGMTKTMFAIWATGKWTPQKANMLLTMATDTMCQDLESGNHHQYPPINLPPINLIHQLIRKNDLKTLKVVLSDERFKGTSEDVKGHTPLDVAIMTVNPDAVDLLLQNRSGHNMTQALAVLEMVKQRGVKNETQQEALRIIEQRLLNTLKHPPQKCPKTP